MMVGGGDAGGDQQRLARAGQPGPARARADQHADVVDPGTARVEVDMQMQ